MTSPSNPYDEFPYKCCPIEWAAPERLALASLLHGGPRSPLDHYRVLELGCGNGANLLPLAFYRRHSNFVGIDGAKSQIDLAEARQAALDLSNLEFIHLDFLRAAERISGPFDYIIAHGVFSWVPTEVRDVLFQLCAHHLRPGGLLYLNYNTRPGWNVRGLVREFLLAQTAGETSLRARAQAAQAVAAQVVSALSGMEHHYSQLLADEFRFVGEGEISWVGHEFLAADNHPYWRGEFLALARSHGLEYVADADFNYGSGRIPEDLPPKLDLAGIIGRSLEDTVDLFCYRQLHSPIFTPAPWTRNPPGLIEFGNLYVASCLEPAAPDDDSVHPMFKHPSGYEVEAREEFMRAALTRLRPLWPGGLRVAEIFPDLNQAMDDLMLLHRTGLIELRGTEPEGHDDRENALNRLERAWGGYVTTPDHTTIVPEA